MVPAFQALFERQGRDLGRFYAAVKTLARLGKAQRNDGLQMLLPQNAALAIAGAAP
jgi:predicted aminopeptidase